MAPNRLARHTLAPLRSTLLVDEEYLRFDREGEEHEIDLDVHPVLRLFVDSLRMLLAGDVERLRTGFRILFQLVGEAEECQWMVRLEPRDQSLQRFISAIHVAGRGLLLSQLRIVEESGDETRMDFSGVDPGRRFSEREASELFRLPSS